MSFVTEKPVGAVRKRRRCDVCCQTIEIGEPAIRWAGMTDGDFGSFIFHPECRTAEIAYNQMASSACGEWYSLNHDREEDDNAWILAEHPIVAARMGIKP